MSLLLFLLLLLFLEDLFWSLLGFRAICGMVDATVDDAGGAEDDGVEDDRSVEENEAKVVTIEVVLGEGGIFEGIVMGKDDDKVMQEHRLNGEVTCDFTKSN